MKEVLNLSFSWYSPLLRGEGEEALKEGTGVYTTFPDATQQLKTNTITLERGKNKENTRQQLLKSIKIHQCPSKADIISFLLTCETNTSITFVCMCVCELLKLFWSFRQTAQVRLRTVFFCV